MQAVWPRGIALEYMYKINYYNQKHFTFGMPLKWAIIIGYM